MNPKYKLNVFPFSVDFENDSNGFVEVIISVNGKDIKEGKVVTKATKGLCYPPGYHKSITTSIKKGSRVKVYVYEGKGEERVDLDRPAILRRKEGRKAVFHRKSSEPAEVIELIA